jgi:ABC-type nitrate/sulfonate/bicarbonate transport system permease component
MTASITLLPSSSRSLPRWTTVRSFVVPIFSVGVFILLYEFAISGVIASETYLPSTIAIGTALIEILGGPALWEAIASTLGVAFGGFAIGAGIAILVGLVSGRNVYVYRALRITVDFLRSIPTVALIPLIVLLLGPTENGRIFLVAFTVAPPVYIQTVYGVQDANPVAIDTARSFGLRRWETLLRIVFPSAAGYLATAIRIFLVISVLVAVSAELILGGGSGVGAMLRDYSQVANYPAMYAMVLVIGLMGMLMVVVVTRLERMMLFWHPSYRSEAN